MNGRLVRATLMLVGLPLLVAAFSVGRPASLPQPPLPPAFDRASAVTLAGDLARSYPDRAPGTTGAAGAARWFRSQLTPYLSSLKSDVFGATIPGRGRVRLENIYAVVPGRSPQTIVVMAHRDDAGTGRGANDNASGTAVLIQLARTYASQPAEATQPASPAHNLLFLSTDGGAFGGLGAEHFVETWPQRDRIAAVVNLDALGGKGRPRLEFAGDEPVSPPAALVQTAAARILDETRGEPGRPSALAQLVDLAFPFSLYEQAPFVARRIPALTLTTSGARPVPSFADTRIDGARLAGLGRATQSLLGSLDQGIELEPGPSSYVYLGSRIVRGWAIELVLIALIVPFVVGAVDLYARCRRRRISLGPALRSYRSRLALWLWCGAVFLILDLLGAWPRGAPRPPAPDTSAAGDWPLLGISALLALCALGWLVARDRLVPRRPVRLDEELAGATATLLVLAVLALVVVATNPFALLFVLPSLHAWLWLPQMRERPLWARAAVLLAGFAGPALLLGSFAIRFGLGLDAPWYVAELYALGYAQPVGLAITLGWLAAAGQLTALAFGRYTPYPSARERPRLGPIRRALRRLVLGGRARRQAAEVERRAAGG